MTQREATCAMVKLKKALFWVLLLVLVMSFLEVSSFTAGKILQHKRGMWRVPTSPEATRENVSYEEYLRRRDPVLGWPYRTEYGANLDVNGANRNPFFPDGPARGSCISLYGDSFTQGGDVTSNRKTWGSLLSEELGCYVANFGMGGYGTDQAYLRFLENRSDPSAVVIFGLHPADLVRNLTRIRDLETCVRWFALKPRFVLDHEGQLELVPIPTLTEEEYLRVLTVRGPQLVLEHENLHPGGPAGVVKLQFPYTISVTKNVLKFYGFRSLIFRYPEYMEFAERGHPLHGLEITVAITREFARLARERGKAPVVVILPYGGDIPYYLKHGLWPYHTITEDFRRNELAFIDFGPYLVSVAQQLDKNLAEYFGPTGHYNDEGNALVARFVLNYLRENGLMPLTN